MSEKEIDYGPAAYRAQRPRDGITGIGQAPTKDRNPDAISSILDQIANVLAGISAKLQGTATLVRGAVPAVDSEKSMTINGASIVQSATVVLAIAHDINTQVDELQRLL